MHRMLALCIAAMALSACSATPQSQALTPELLDDQQALSKIVNRLEPTDRQHFNRYIMNRVVGSRMFPDQAMLMPDGKDPSTVGEAIALSRAWNDRNTRIRALEDERTAKLDVISKQQETIDPFDTAAYNASVAEYNAVIEDYKDRIEQERAKPLVLDGD